MPGINVALDPVPPGFGLCERCGLTVALQGERMVDHTRGGRLIGTLCEGSGEQPWTYKG